MLETRQAETQHIQQALNEGLATNSIEEKEAMDLIRKNLQEKHGV